MHIIFRCTISLFILHLLLLPTPKGWTQTLTLAERPSPAGTLAWEVKGAWLDEQQVLHERLLQQGEEAEVSYHAILEFPCVIEDTLWIHFEHVVGLLEVELDGKYLGQNTGKYGAWSLFLLPEWTGNTRHRLRLTFSPPQQPQLSLKVPWGMVGDCFISDTPQSPFEDQGMLPKVAYSDTVAFVAPYFRKHGLEFDLLEACHILLPLVREKQYKLRFSFPPDPRFVRLCSVLGFHEVDSISDQTYIAYINVYPFEKKELDFSPTFWVDEEGNRSMHYGVYEAFDKISAQSHLHSQRFLLTLLALLPIAFTFIIKVLNPSFVNNWLPILINPQLFLDSFSDASFANTGFIWVLTLLRLLLLTLFGALLLYLIQLQNSWDLLNVFSERSWLYEYFVSRRSLWEMLIATFGVVMGLFFLKQLIIFIVGNVFRLKNFLSGELTLGLVGAFPMIVVLPFPILLLLYGDHGWVSLWMTLLFVLVFFFLARKFYVYYVGLGRMFGFSSAVKFMYICSLDILPYCFGL